MLLALGGLTAGLASNPAVPAWAALAGAALLAGFNLFLAVGLRSLMERLMGIRRLREALALVFILCAALPQLLTFTGVPHGLRRVVLTPPNAWLPSSAAARVVLGESPADSAAVALLWVAAAYWFARRQFRRSLRFDSAAALARGARGPAGAGWSERIYGLPALLAPDPLAALIQKELRSLARSPRFRVLLLMGLTFGMVVWLPAASRGGHVNENYPLYVSFYAVVLTAEVIIWNQFGFDRGATQLYFIAPVGMRQVLRAKNAAAVLFILLEVAVLLLCLALRVRLTGAKVIEIYAVILVALLYFLAAGNLSSLYQPRAMDPERTWGRGASSRFQWQAVLLLPLLMAPLALAYLARYTLGSQAAFYLVLAVDALVGLAAYHFALDRAVRASERRQELLFAALSQGSGPIIVE
jgi:ABC-2 type transport system permease protein